MAAPLHLSSDLLLVSPLTDPTCESVGKGAWEKHFPEIYSTVVVEGGVEVGGGQQTSDQHKCEPKTG